MLSLLSRIVFLSQYCYYLLISYLPPRVFVLVEWFRHTLRMCFAAMHCVVAGLFTTMASFRYTSRSNKVHFVLLAADADSVNCKYSLSYAGIARQCLVPNGPPWSQPYGAHAYLDSVRRRRRRRRGRVFPIPNPSRLYSDSSVFGFFAQSQRNTKQLEYHRMNPLRRTKFINLSTLLIYVI